MHALSPRPVKLVAGLIACGALVVSGTGPSWSAPPGEPDGRYVAGAPGIGDDYYPLYGNGGYDVRHYGLDLDYDPATDRLEGVATIDATATADLYRFNLDFVGMQIESIEVNDKRARWTRTDHELVVTPQRKLKSGEPIETVVRYGGVPQEFLIPGTDIRSGFMATDDGANVAGEPEVAASWYPVNDHPLDKASYTFDITVPDDVEVVANGVLRSESTEGGWTRFVWDAEEPMASYLATIDVGEWDIREWTTSSGLPVYDAVDPDLVTDPELGPAIDSSLARQGEIIDVLDASFGPYPFSTLGAIVDDQDDLFFALETQTRPVYSKYFWPDFGDLVVVHELAHQWYGDDVAVADWQHIWLNEGFASYAEWLWTEHEGIATPQQIFEEIYADIPADDPFWDVVIGDPGVPDLFAGAVYVRGAMTLQALRNEVGDEAFFAILRQWAAQQSGGNATTDEFIALSEEVSGQQLDDLFEVWLFTPEKPATPAAAGLRAQGAQDGSAAAFARQWRDLVDQRLAVKR